jgi:ABC-type Zn uptake system ZnuABC Zn-binding protein ZnuA
LKNHHMTLDAPGRHLYNACAFVPRENIMQGGVVPMKKGVSIAIWVVICIVSFSLGMVSQARAGEKTIRILATTFPIYQITRNVTDGYAPVTVSSLFSATAGCPHDYILTPRDMEKLAKTDILVINGLGMEEFLGAPVKKANAGLKIVDSSSGIGSVLPYNDTEEVEHGHHHMTMNPHLFASPRMSALLASTIARELSALIPAGASVFSANAAAYGAKMNALADRCGALGAVLKNKRIITQHGVFDYLARDMGISVVAVLDAHPGAEPSAAQMLHLVKIIRKDKPGAIFIEPQYPEKTARALSRETGIPVAVLDPAATGPENAPKAYYETIMEKNMATLKQTLGTAQ